MKLSILLVDDDEHVRRSVERLLRRSGHGVRTASNGAEALESLKGDGEFDLLLTDVSMPRMSGIELLRALKEEGLSLPTLVMSGEATVAKAVEAVRLGAADFLEKPVSKERLLVSLERCVERARLKAENAFLRADGGGASELLGSSPALRELKSLVARVAPTEGRVLITGENGTGKELVANAIHAGSARRDGPFIKLNCSAVPRELIESELFGHERGAFTGAVKKRLGRFELADGGTLFLDEIGDMPLEMQTKVLRVLQEGQLERVGGSRTLDVDVRVVAATNRDLPAMVDAGDFREDLFYRLQVVHLQVPPLRARLDDVPELARVFLEEAARRNRRSIRGFTAKGLEALQGYDYPGNVRELRNLVERLVILVEGEEIGAEDVQGALSGRRSRPERLYRPGVSLNERLEQLEKQILEEAIQSEGSKAAASRALDVERSFFYKKCKRLGVDGD